MTFEPVPDAVEALASRVLDCCFRVHKELGPGLYESVYETCLCHELDQAGIAYHRQLQLPVRYRGLVLDRGFFIDILVGDCIVLELKSVDRLTDTDEAQLLTYMKLSRNRLGFLINFHSARLKDGLRRRVV